MTKVFPQNLSFCMIQINYNDKYCEDGLSISMVIPHSMSWRVKWTGKWAIFIWGEVYLIQAFAQCNYIVKHVEWTQKFTTPDNGFTKHYRDGKCSSSFQIFNVLVLCEFGIIMKISNLCKWILEAEYSLSDQHIPTIWS